MQLVGVQQAVVVGQKGVGWVRGGLAQTAGDCDQWQGLGVCGLGHDAQAADLIQRAGGPAVGNLLLQPLGGSGVVLCDMRVRLQLDLYGDAQRDEVPRRWIAARYAARSSRLSTASNSTTRTPSSTWYTSR